MSSFFTLPKSQKRKRSEGQASGTKRIRTGGAAGAGAAGRASRGRSGAGGLGRGGKAGTAGESQRHPNSADDESISGSESGFSGDEGYESARSDLSDEKETEAERRLRLAEEYLQSLRDEATQEVGFDAEEIDRDLIAERLKEDVAESKGKLYRFIASSFSWQDPLRAFFTSRDDAVTTAVAGHGDYVYTATKDLIITRWKLPKVPPPPLTTTIAQNEVTRSRETSPHPELSKAKRRKLREKRRKSRGGLANGTDNKARASWANSVKRLVSTTGSHRRSSERSYQNHTGPILALACSPDGRLLVSGGADKRMIVWDAETLTPKRVFTQHRAAVTGLAFRRNSNQLFSASADRTVKVWSLDEMAYVETLFGHQDEVYDVGALGQERCVSVGGRDRTARVWKVVEETQLVFRGGGSAAEKEGRRDRRNEGTSDRDLRQERKNRSAYGEGSIDRVALLDDEMFVTGSDNGSLSLWSVQKKKPVYTVTFAHGLDPPLSREKAFADMEMDEDAEVPGPPLPRWITALAAVPYSDLVVSGSWDGAVRIWRVSEDKRRLEAVGSVGVGPISSAITSASALSRANGKDDIADGSAPATLPANDRRTSSGARDPLAGVVNDLKVVEQGERGKETVYIVAAVGKEPRLGRWFTKPGKNGTHVIAVTRQ